MLLSHQVQSWCASVAAKADEGGALYCGTAKTDERGAVISGHVWIALVFVSIFSDNGLYNLDRDCCAIISPTYLLIESCIIFLCVLVNSCINNSRFFGSVISGNHMILFNIHKRKFLCFFSSLSQAYS
jgi:hypothetical protein